MDDDRHGGSVWGRGRESRGLEAANEFVADAMDGLDVSIGGAILELAAQVENMGVDRTGRDLGVVVPNLLKQYVSAEDLSAMVDEKAEELHFFGREADSVAVDAQVVGGEVNGDVVEGVDLFVGLFLLGSPEQRTHSCVQLKERKGLGDVVVAAYVEAGELVDLFAFGREEQHRARVAPRTEPAADVEAVHTWKHDVENDEVGILSEPYSKSGVTG